jgi:hypothetical protein
VTMTRVVGVVVGVLVVIVEIALDSRGVAHARVPVFKRPKDYFQLISIFANTNILRAGIMVA